LRAAPVALAAATVSAGAACNTHQCDPSCQWLGGTPAPGQGIGCGVDPSPVGNVYENGNDLIWESGPVDGTWRDFRGQEAYTFLWPAPFAGHLPYSYESWVSTSPTPQDPQNGGPQINASGQLAQYTSVSPWGLVVENASCAEYYLRVVAYAHTNGPLGASVDAGVAPEDASPTGGDAQEERGDGAADASADAP
jgi:hypothetical protein